MKNYILKLTAGFILSFCMTYATHAGIETHTLKEFNKIVVSQYIEAELISGNEEGIRIEYENIDKDDINVQIKGRTLHVFLQDARLYDKSRRGNNSKWYESRYKHSKIKVYITYKSLKSLQVRGEERIVVNSAISSKRFKLKLYGESEVRLNSLETNYLKVVMFGENELKIMNGNIGGQKYRSFGENKIDTKAVESAWARTSIFGESDIVLNVTEDLFITSLGESRISFKGNPIVSKGIMIGITDIHRIK